MESPRMHRYDPNGDQSAAALKQARRNFRQDVAYGIISAAGILSVAYLCAVYWRP